MRQGQAVWGATALHQRRVYLIFCFCLKHSYSMVKTLTWEEVNLSFGEQCPNVLGLVDLLRTLPASSADAERGFSHMKMVKSDWRSRLSDRHLSDLMTIQMETAEVDQFDPSPAVKLWTNAGPRNRRPDFVSSTVDSDSGSEVEEVEVIETDDIE